MTVRVFKSTMTGAPVMSGSTAGVGIAILDACLINGFNSVSISSMTRSGTTVTVNATAHGFSMGDPAQGRRALIAGANETQYNGEWTVATVPTVNQFTFEIATTPASPATGTITVKRAGAGWTSPFTGTNLAVYRPVSGNRFYLRVDDTATAVATSSVPMRTVAYETMSAVSTGTNPFPTVAQMSGGYYMPRSSASDANARAWCIVSSDTGFYMIIDYANSGTFTSARGFYFGDFVSYKTGDAYNTILTGHLLASLGNASQRLADIGYYSAVSNAHVAARSYTQTGTAVAVGKNAYQAGSNNLQSGFDAILAYPNPVDGGIYVSPMFVHENTAQRGVWSGLYCLIQSAGNFGNFDTFSGSGSLAGKTFMIVKMNGSSGDACGIALEVSDTW